MQNKNKYQIQAKNDFTNLSIMYYVRLSQFVTITPCPFWEMLVPDHSHDHRTVQIERFLYWYLDLDTVGMPVLLYYIGYWCRYPVQMEFMHALLHSRYSTSSRSSYGDV